MNIIEAFKLMNDQGKKIRRKGWVSEYYFLTPSHFYFLGDDDSARIDIEDVLTEDWAAYDED